MKALDAIHDSYVHGRRVRRLAALLAALVPGRGSVLDVGCGDGLLAYALRQARPELRIVGLDVLVRPHTYIPVRGFDGLHLPYDDDRFDAVLFVDVLHHASDPMALLAEAGRVARERVLIKDHLLEGFLAAQTLRFMDWVGNARHGVALPYHYWSRRQWQDAFRTLGWHTEDWQEDLRLYPAPFDWLFGRRLHFLARLRPRGPG